MTGDMPATVRGLRDTSFVLCGPRGETRLPVEVTGQPMSAQDVGAGVGSLTSGPQAPWRGAGASAGGAGLARRLVREGSLHVVAFAGSQAHGRVLPTPLPSPRRPPALPSGNQTIADPPT